MASRRHPKEAKPDLTQHWAGSHRVGNYSMPGPTAAGTILVTPMSLETPRQSKYAKAA